LPLSHEAARLSVDRQDNNNRGMGSYESLKNKSLLQMLSLGRGKYSCGEN